MRFDIKVLSANDAEAIRKQHARHAKYLKGVKHKFRKALGIASHDLKNIHRNVILEDDNIKDWDKFFKKEHKLTFMTIGDKNYTDFEIAFTTKKELKNNEQLYIDHLQHLANIYDDIEQWFMDEFGKIPIFSCIHGDEDVPHINMIFNNFRKNSKGKYFANEDSFFELHERMNDYPDLKGKKYTNKVRKELLKRLRHEFWTKFGKPLGSKEEAENNDKFDIINTTEVL